MALIMAIGSSLVSVTAFGLTTAANYALSDLIDWRLVLLFVGGGTAGGLVGGRLATALAAKKRALSLVFAVVVASVGVYVVVRGLINMMGDVYLPRSVSGEGNSPSLRNQGLQVKITGPDWKPVSEEELEDHA
jgi:uncharacterized membrane protein YfcA